MSALHQHDHAPEDPDHKSGGGHSKWAMVACCIPMLVIALAIAFSGAGFGFLLIAVACTAMMLLMMGSMSGGKH
jgi:hypothetical protein